MKNNYFKMKHIMTPKELNESLITNDSDFILSLVEEMLNKQEEDIIKYMNDVMSQEERDKHGDNIYNIILNSGKALSKIKIKMLSDGREIK